jgi:NADPH-dependent glutamate synthase beta subunit-like oxidoreductase
VAQPACAETCPGNIEIPAYMEHVRNGDLRTAALIILASNPIPAITGRVCPHLCESKCNRSEFDEAVSIRNVERVVGDYILDNAEEFLTAPKKQLKKSVAIVGAGPAGLSAAYYLRKAGYQVTVYDKMPEAGGMLTYGIPAYRLPKEVIRRQVKAFEAMWIKFKLNVTIGQKSHTLNDLRKNPTVFSWLQGHGARDHLISKNRSFSPLA